MNPHFFTAPFLRVHSFKSFVGFCVEKIPISSEMLNA